MSYLFFLLVGMLLMMWAQFHIKGTYAKYAQIESSLGMTGAEVAETILKEMGIHHLAVEPIAGKLIDHYDLTAKAVRLSEVVYGSRSLAALTYVTTILYAVLQLAQLLLSRRD